MERRVSSCFIRISKILLYAIHNSQVLCSCKFVLFYQDFKDTFVCNTQRILFELNKQERCFIRISKILLYAIHNPYQPKHQANELFYQDFKDTFVCNTQPTPHRTSPPSCCFIRISKILLYAIHNYYLGADCVTLVVLSGFQRYFCMQYTTTTSERIA